MNGLYIHLPFCIKKCAYCDFVSYEHSLQEAGPYVEALLEEMEQYRGEPADTLYIGGGTPTALPPHLLVRLIEGVRACFALPDSAEITVEANPGTCDLRGLQQLAAAGVNRVSLGAQSFVDNELAALGRIHSADQIARAAADIRRAGIQNLSLDLMFSLPGQSRESLAYSLTQLLHLAPDHVSCYSLTLCENTPLWQAVQRGAVSLPDDDTDRALYALLCRTLQEHGYDRYEISNFARPGRESRHNTKYWTRAPYIGLGAAAHSFYNGRRCENPARLLDYYDSVRSGRPRAGETVTAADAMAEFMFLGLRMTKTGARRRAFFESFGKTLDECYGPAIDKLCRLGLLTDAGDRLLLTDRGIDLSNSVFCEFL